MADTIKAKVKTATMTMDINGPLDGAIGEIFVMVKTPERREKIIADLQKTHASMVEWEREKAQGGGNGGH